MSAPTGIWLTELDCEELIAIPRRLRKERGWTGARSVGMAKLIEDRLYQKIAAILHRESEGVPS